MMQNNLKYQKNRGIIIKINNSHNHVILKDLKTKNNPPISINIAAP